MDSKYIEQLLERYWQGETSLEEEATLRAFFSGDNAIPRHLLRYKELFVYQQFMRQEGLGEDFDARVLAAIEEPVVVKAKRITLFTRLAPLFKAAAVVAIMLSLGTAIRHSFDAEVREVAATDTIGKQITAPSMALSGELPATGEQQIMDSLKRAGELQETLEE